MGFIFDLLFVSLLDLYMKNATNATLNRHFKSEILRKKKVKINSPPWPTFFKGLIKQCELVCMLVYVCENVRVKCPVNQLKSFKTWKIKWSMV